MVSVQRHVLKARVHSSMFNVQMFTVQMFTVQMFSVQMFTVQMFTVQMFIVRVHSSVFIVYVHSSMFIVYCVCHRKEQHGSTQKLFYSLSKSDERVYQLCSTSTYAKNN